MRFLMYLSAARTAISEDDIDDIIASSVRNNGRNGVTGVLLAIGGNFIQALEGPDDAVEATFERIARDPRHGGIVVMETRETRTRLFPEWSMGLDRPRPDDPGGGALFRVTEEAVRNRVSDDAPRIVEIFMRNLYEVGRRD